MLRCTRYLLGSLALLITLAGLSSCGDKWQRKLSDKKLRQLIGELYKADCLMDNLGNSINDTMRLALEDQIFEKYGITFVLSVSMDASALPENAKKNVTVEL